MANVPPAAAHYRFVKAIKTIRWIDPKLDLKHEKAAHAHHPRFYFRSTAYPHVTTHRGGLQTINGPHEMAAHRADNSRRVDTVDFVS